MPRGVHGATLEPHVGGAVSDLPELLIPAGMVRRSQNMLPRFGRLMTRPGLARALQTGLGARGIGGITYKTATGAARIVASTRTKWFKKDATTWTDITPAGQLAATDDDHQRYVMFPTGTPQTNLLIGVNNVDTPKKWDGATATFGDLGGSPPIARDVLTTDNYVVLLNVVEAGNRFTTRIRASATNNPESWPATFSWDLPSGGDEIVGGRTLSRTSFAVYKEDSQWVGIQAPGTLPFRFERVDEKPGPVSPAAIVADGRYHYYLGTDVRVYRFNGLAAEPVTDALDREFLRLMRGTSRRRSFGLRRRDDGSIWFIFPSGAEDADHGISYFPDTGAAYFHVFGVKLSAGWSGDDIPTVTWADLAGFTWDTIAATYPTWESFGGQLVPIEYLASVTGHVYRFQYGFDDDGAAIPMLWETPRRAWMGTKVTHRVDGLESSFRQQTGGPAVSVSVGVSEALAEEHPAYTAVGTHDTTLATRQLLTKDGLEGRFLSVKYEASTLSGVGVEYQGALLHLWAEEVA
jgi:hypothetical protein